MQNIIKESPANSALNVISAISAASSLESFQLIDVFESISDAIFIKDHLGRWVATNAAARRLFKLNLESWVGKTDADLARKHPWYKRALDAYSLGDEEAWLSGSPFQKTEIIPDGDGDFIYLEVLRVPIFNGDGSRKVLVIIGRDVTDSVHASDRLALSRLKLGHLHSIASAGSFEWDLRGGVVICSEECITILGLPNTSADFAFNYGHLLNAVYGSDRKEFDLMIKRAISKASNFNLLHRVLLDNGAIRYINTCGDVIKDANGGAVKIVGTAYDMTSRREIEHGLVLADRVFDHSNDGIIITNAQKEIIKVNRMFCTITGLTPNEVIGKTSDVLFSGQHSADFYENIWKSVHLNSYWDGELLNRRKSGEVYATWTTMSVIYNDYNEIANYVTVFSDVSAHNDSLSRIAHISKHDPLTGLPNRSMLFDRVAQAMMHADATKSSFAVLHIDVDKFKSVNDTHGTYVGDFVLKEVAKTLTKCAGGQSTVARIGGDEFFIIHECSNNLTEAERLANCVIDSISSPITIDNIHLNLGVSVGISIYPEHGSTAEEITTRAGMAMYHAKNKGRSNFQFYNQEMNANMLKRLYIENGLKTALSCGELQLHYQPQINSKTGEMVGVEALVRWMHPEIGMIPPVGFIDIAEENGMIVKIGEWALMEACNQMVQWQNETDLRISVAVNISPMQFRDKMFESVISNALRVSGLPPECLEIEITESVIMHSAVEIIERMRRIKNMGVKISIDDFGTGYSSLAYLRKFSIDKIKIDRSFISESDIGKNEMAIISAIIAMAKSLNIKVIAEGVETENQSNILKSLDCDEMQGFYYCKPVPHNMIMEMLKKLNKNKID